VHGIREPWWPIEDEPDGEPYDDFVPGAQRALRRVGLDTAHWRRRLRHAPPWLVRFINRFHRVPGFQHVVRATGGSRYQQHIARMLTRLAWRLQERHGDGPGAMRFEMASLVAPNGDPLRTVTLVHRGRHYQALPWRRLHQHALQRLLHRNTTRHGRSGQVRLVFDRDRLEQGRRSVASAVRRLLGPDAPPSWRYRPQQLLVFL
jgi:hypothetical protein